MGPVGTLAGQLAQVSGSLSGLLGHQNHVHKARLRRLEVFTGDRDTRGRPTHRARDGHDLLIRRVPLGFAGFLTCAGFPRFRGPGFRTPGFSGFSPADPLAACGLPVMHTRAEQPAHRRKWAAGPNTYRDALCLALYAISLPIWVVTGGSQHSRSGTHMGPLCERGGGCSSARAVPASLFPVSRPVHGGPSWRPGG